MTDAQRLELKISENRQRAAILAGKADLTDDDRAEMDTLTNEQPDIERRWRAATIAEADADTGAGGPDAATSELADIETRADIGNIAAAVADMKPTDGAEAELQKHYGVGSDAVPLRMLLDAEHRTSGGTAAPADVGAVQQPIIPYIFPMGSAAWLRIPTPTVSVGESNYTVISTAAAPGTPAESGDQATSAAALTASVLSPQRIQAALFYTREDAARLRGMGESLRQNLRDALSDEFDSYILQGDTVGLLTGTVLANNNTNTVDDFATYVKRFGFDQIDGRYASDVSDLRLLLGSDTYGDMAATYRANGTSMQALGALQAATGGVRVSGNMVATASNKQNGIVRRGGPRLDAVAPVWEGVQIIVDPYTQSKAGEIILTAVMLAQFAVLRAAGFAKVQAQHS